VILSINRFIPEIAGTLDRWIDGNFQIFKPTLLTWVFDHGYINNIAKLLYYTS
jgi:hypothetical protein